MQVKGTGGALRVVVAGAQGPAFVEATDPELAQSGLPAPGQHHVRRPPPDDLRPVPDGVGGSGAGGHHARNRAPQVEPDGSQPGRFVGNDHRHRQRAQPVRPPLQHHPQLPVEGQHPPQAGADDGPRPLRPLRVVESQSGVGEGLHRRPDEKLGEPVHAAGLPAGNHRLRVPVPHLPPESGGHRRRVEGGQCGNAGAPGQNSVPGVGDVMAEGGDRPHAGHHHPPPGAHLHLTASPLGRGTLPKTRRASCEPGPPPPPPW